MRAAAWGERTVRPKRASSAQRSEPKAKRPRTLGTPSGRGTLVPIRGGAPVVDGDGHRRGAPLAGRHPHGFDDPAVAGAAAEVPRDGLADLEVGRLRGPVEQVVHRHDQAGRAEAALDGALVDERRLHGGQLAVVLLALDGLDRLAHGGRGQDQARAHEGPADLHRARPALALLAGVLGAGQVEAVPQDVEQALAQPGVLDLVGPAVHPQGVGQVHPKALRTARSARTATAWRR